MKRKSLEKWIPLFTLPLTLAVCLVLWIVMSNNTYTEVLSENGVWDLRSFDFKNESARVVGDVEFIPNVLLTPEEFEARSDEILVGRPEDICQYATSRIRLLLPDNATYMLAGRSTDYSDRMYINGKWIVNVGSPGDSRETTIPNTADLTFMGEPEDGVLEIVQQVSNFVHREGGNHSDFRIGYPDVVRATYRHDVTAIIMGCFLALFLVHLTLYFILRVYKANLYFALFCLMWFLRTGVTGVKVFSSLLPGLSWYVKFRMEYVALPVTGILIILMLHEMFPDILPKWFRRAVYVVSGAFVALFLFTDTVFMSWAMFGCYAYQAVSILIVLVCFIRKFRSPDSTQMVSLAGTAIFLYAGLRDMFYYSDILLPPFVNADLSQISMLIFVFFQMTAMFMGTVHAAEEAKAAEQRLTAENALLARMDKLKTEFLGNLSHELKLPLAVVSSHAQVVRVYEEQKAEPDAFIIDRMLLAASEAERLAGVVTQLLDLTRIEENRIDCHIEARDIVEIIREAINTFYPVLNKNHNTIKTDLPKEFPAALCDAERVNQVLLNLISNSIRFTRYGVITVSVREENGFAAVTVRDTGTGIESDRLPFIFDRYFSTAPDGNGTGLGLYITRQLVEAQGGKIKIESEPGKGTAVTFTLPLAGDGKEDKQVI